MSPNPPVQRVSVSEQEAGSIDIVPPTFLEWWGVVFVSCAGGWILLVGSGLLIHFLRNQPAIPSFAGLTAEQAKDALSVHLLVTKTALPLVTLLLGYLFGKGKS